MQRTGRLDWLEKGVNKMGMREIFIENGIPYDDIDKELIVLLDVLNFELELPTEFCCFGHDNALT